MSVPAAGVLPAGVAVAVAAAALGPPPAVKNEKAELLSVLAGGTDAVGAAPPLKKEKEEAPAETGAGTAAESVTFKPARKLKPVVAPSAGAGAAAEEVEDGMAMPLQTWMRAASKVSGLGDALRNDGGGRVRASS